MAAMSFAWAPSITARDWMKLPEPERRYASADASYSLLLSNTDDWSSRRVDAELYHLAGEEGKRVLLWSRRLPHEYGPRHALVSPDGYVLLVDEWVNVKSRYAVMVLDPAGRTIATHAYDEVQATLGVEPSELASMASGGVWVEGAPRLVSAGVAIIPAGGRQLRVRLTDGTLDAR